MIKAIIDEAAIEAKLKAWKSSAAGNQKIYDTIDDYIKQDIRLTERHYRVLTYGQMREIAEHFVDYLKDAASSVGAESVQRDISSLTVGKITAREWGRPSRGFSVELNFANNLYRPSLDQTHKNGGSGKQYPGINNIIALFNNGYTASSSVYGYWDGRGNVWSLSEREPLGFMQAAAERFNAEYGEMYNITVTIADIYQ